MIELIFAIVVMGIVLLSAPMLVKVASKSNAVSLQQESIAILAQHLNAMMSHAWDEQNTESQGHYGILSTTSSTTVLKRENNITAGMIRRQERNATGGLVRIYASPASNFGENVDPDPLLGTETVNDDVDDFSGTSYTLTLANSDPAITVLGNYIDKDINITTTVVYARDAASSPDLSTCLTGNGCAYSNPQPETNATRTTNVKYVTSTLTSAVFPDKNITMKMFMSNIGTLIPKGAVK